MRPSRCRHGCPRAFCPDATAVALDLLAMADFLCGSAAVRGGTCASLPAELTAGFRVEPRSFPRDPLQWEAPAGWWRPPGNWLFVGKTPRQASLTLAVRCLEVLEGIAPLEERRRALLELYRQRQADPELAAQDAAAPRDDLESLWSESAGPEILAVLPELAGPEGYLGWACEGLAAAHEQLESAVPGVPPVLDTTAHLVLQAGLEHAPAGLASVAGTGGYLAVQERITAAGKFDPRAWAARTREWLGRGLAAGQIDACRGLAGHGVRITGILQGLPDVPGPAGTVLAAGRRFPARRAGAGPAPADRQPAGHHPGAAAGHSTRSPAG